MLAKRKNELKREEEAKEHGPAAGASKRGGGHTVFPPERKRALQALPLMGLGEPAFGFGFGRRAQPAVPAELSLLSLPVGVVERIILSGGRDVLLAVRGTSRGLRDSCDRFGGVRELVLGNTVATAAAFGDWDRAELLCRDDAAYARLGDCLGLGSSQFWVRLYARLLQTRGMPSEEHVKALVANNRLEVLQSLRSRGLP